MQILKTSDEINTWLSVKKFFEWTTLNLSFESNQHLLIHISFNDIKDKVAREKYFHWDVTILMRNVKEVFREYDDWCIEKQSIVAVKEKLNILECINEINNSKQISLKSLDNLCGFYFDDWLSSGSCAITANEIEIQLENCEELILNPELSNKYISFKYLNKNFPDCTFWIDELKNEGIECSFIEYFLNPVDIKEVPKYDYDNWSLRPLIPKGQFPFGVNICCIERDELSKKIIFELQEESLTNFFENIKAVASKKPLIEVKCGNVLFTESDWKQFLKQKTLN